MVCWLMMLQQCLIVSRRYRYSKDLNDFFPADTAERAKNKAKKSLRGLDPESAFAHVCKELPQLALDFLLSSQNDHFFADTAAGILLRDGSAHESGSGAPFGVYSDRDLDVNRRVRLARDGIGKGVSTTYNPDFVTVLDREAEGGAVEAWKKGEVGVEYVRKVIGRNREHDVAAYHLPSFLVEVRVCLCTCELQWLRFFVCVLSCARTCTL